MGVVSRGGRRTATRLVAASLSLVILLHAGPAAAEDSFIENAGIGLGTALVNVLYIPAKFTYATVGGLIGGFAWLLSLGDTDTAMGVWEPTMGGSYIVTPAMLRGDEPVEFSGTVSSPSSSYADDEVVEEDVQIREYDTQPSDR